LNSVFSQDFIDFETIVSDDTVGDAVSTVVRSTEERYGRKIKYYHNEYPAGTPQNWNLALRRASGSAVIIMHHDDWFYNSNTLSLLVKCMTVSGADLVFAKSVNVNENMETISVNDPPDEVVRKIRRDSRNLFYGNFIGAPSAVLFKNHGLFFDERLKWLVDVDFYMRILEHGTIQYVRQAAVGIGISPTQVTKSCEGNKTVEIGENIYVYNNLGSKLKNLNCDYKHFRGLFQKFLPMWKDVVCYSPRGFIRLFFIRWKIFSLIKRAIKIALGRQ
jgi:glycosyltransferase involved in cell wall biosynthesis